ncbi:hypothetical protein [Gimesia aquarii]|uniref:Uncharacterized protein n=1 Tax=Gimesia aquarii TaxID=2527964 RepID=A0A517WSD0_9PLAN|nr:hypothetical protein [Gimesia aquarii]QDU08165.1 hypothetical protein V202x_15290 [Gimesia aquarii]
MKIIDENIILRWSGTIPDFNKNISWYIRGICSDGSFYGEVKIREHGNNRIILVDGRLSTQDSVSIRELVNQIAKINKELDTDIDLSEGFLGYGSISDPQIIFEYSSQLHSGTESETLILRIVDLLAPYMLEFVEKNK